MSVTKSAETVARLRKALAEYQITKFQHNVYTQLLAVPQGRVTTYKEIAKAINCNSAQAIGQALQKNPFAPDVPCHRVIRSDLTLGGFSGSLTNSTVDRKKKLLQSEGVQFVDVKDDRSSQAKVSEKSIWTFD